MVFTKIGGKHAEIPPGTAKVYDVGGREVAVCNVNGDLYAIDNLCSHEDASLGQGEMIGYEIECPRHGSRFDVRDGDSTEPPAVLPLDTFPVRLDGDDIEIEL